MHNNYTTKPAKKQPHPNQKFIDSDKLDAKLVRQWIAGDDMRNARQYLVDEKERNLRIPASWYAIDVLAPSNGIKKLDEQLYLTTMIGHDGNPFAFYYGMVKVGKGFGKYATSRWGAGGWVDPIVALKFAERNAIRQLLPQETLAYSITRKTLKAAKAEVQRRYV